MRILSNMLSKWLQMPPTDSLEQQCQDLTNQLRAKEKALETTAYDLKVKTAATYLLEQKIMSSETMFSSAQREITARDEQLKALEAELAVQTNRVKDLEAEGVALGQRVGEINSIMTAKAEELRGAQQACRAAEQAQDVLKEEIRVLREHIAQLNDGLADRDHLRAHVKKLELTQDRVHRLEVELSDREAAHRDTIQQLERSLTERDHRISEFDANAAAQAEEVRVAQQACRAAEQAQDVLKEEIRVLREHIAQLNDGLADRDRLRAHVKKLESLQDRVHQLEVELSDREAAHRDTTQQLERSLTERDRQVEKIGAATNLLREKESEITEWERKYTRTAQEHEGEVAKLQEQCAAQEQLRKQHRLDEQRLHERDELIAKLHRQLDELQAAREDLLQEVQRLREKDEHIQRLRKRLKEMRGTLSEKAAPAAQAASRQSRQNGAGQNSHARLIKSGKNKQEDDLKKINGIGPVFAQTLNQIGTRTFIQIARWKPEDIEKIAKKLETDPERIKRDNWIADAKEQHYQKYGERL